jgi:hypothetical protein
MKISCSGIVKCGRNFGATALAVGLAAALFAPVSRAQEDKDKGKEAEQGPKVAKVEISPKEAKAEVGSSLQFTAVAKDDSGKVVDAKVTVWFAAPFDAAGADTSGKVYFSAPGEITVGALIGQEVGLAKVMVAKPAVTHVDIEKLAAPLAVGGSAALVAKPHAADGSSRPDVAVTWKSLTPAIAKVDSAGIVTAVAPGEARIQATAEGVNGEIGVHVIADTVRRLAVDPATTTARTGDVGCGRQAGEGRHDQLVRERQWCRGVFRRSVRRVQPRHLPSYCFHRAAQRQRVNYSDAAECRARD